MQPNHFTSTFNISRIIIYKTFTLQNVDEYPRSYRLIKKKLSGKINLIVCLTRDSLKVTTPVLRLPCHIRYYIDYYYINCSKI